MYRDIWTPIDKETLKELGLSRVRFKGSSSSTKRSIPGQTGQEAALQDSLYNYSQNGVNNAYNYQNTANGLLSGTKNPDWNGLTNGYNNTMAGIMNNYASLTNGELPSSYTDNIQNQLNSMATSSLGNLLAQKASSGTIGSSQFDTGVSNIANSIADTAANKYLDATNTYSNILNNSANNVASVLANNASAQQNSYYAPSQYFNYASNSTTPASNLFNTMYSGRMGTGSTTTSTNDGGSGTWNAVGSLGAAAIMCFVGDTIIATPGGNKYIADIEVGDKVYSLNGAIETVIEVQEPQLSPNEYMLVQTATTEIRPTSTQPFLTTEGDFLPADLAGKELIGKDGNEVVVSVEGNQAREVIFDFKCTGENVYYANGFAVRGRS